MARLRSMTGYGAAEGPLSQRLAAHVRISSVNGRFLEVALRTQPRLDTAELEPAVRTVLGGGVARGRVQVTLTFELRASGETSLSFNWRIAESLVRELEGRPPGLELAPLSLRDLMQLPGFAEGIGELTLAEEERAALLALVGAARDHMVADREKEAAGLLPQVEAEARELDSFAAWLAAVNDEVGARLLVRLRERLATLLEGAAVPEERLVMEAGILAERADVSEEVQRLRVHLQHLRRLLSEGGPVGKKLDFLLQEILREVNTSGSKCREAGIGERVVGAKAAVEKLREQLANLE